VRQGQGDAVDVRAHPARQELVVQCASESSAAAKRVLASHSAGFSWPPRLHKGVAYQLYIISGSADMDGKESAICTVCGVSGFQVPTPQLGRR